MDCFDEQIAKVAADAGMDVATTRNQMAGFVFPTAEDQINNFFGKTAQQLPQPSRLALSSVPAPGTSTRRSPRS